MSKTILFLGGAGYQVPAILQAINQNYYVITCGNVPEDPGHIFSHEYYNISIADQDAVYALVKEKTPDLIMAYVSETALLVSIKVSQKLNLPSISWNTFRLLNEKDRFRNFQKKHSFNYPEFKILSQGNISESELAGMSFPLMVKPVDSSGSRGVSRIEDPSELMTAADYAFSFTQKDRIIVEERINNNNVQLTGDGFVVNGNLEFLYLGDHHYNEKIKAPVAFSTTWPSRITDSEQQRICSEVGKVIGKTGYRNGPVNVDIRIAEDGKIYIIEMAPRNGGNFVPQLIGQSTGVNLLKCYLDRFENKKPDLTLRTSNYTANYIIHSLEKGIFTDLKIVPELKKYILHLEYYKPFGSKVNPYRNLGEAIGVLLLKFNTRKEMTDIIDQMDSYLDVVVKNTETKKWDRVSAKPD